MSANTTQPIFTGFRGLSVDKVIAYNMSIYANLIYQFYIYSVIVGVVPYLDVVVSQIKRWHEGDRKALAFFNNREPFLPLTGKFDNDGDRPSDTVYQWRDIMIQQPLFEFATTGKNAGFVRYVETQEIVDFWNFTGKGESDYLPSMWSTIETKQIQIIGKKIEIKTIKWLFNKANIFDFPVQESGYKLDVWPIETLPEQDTSDVQAIENNGEIIVVPKDTVIVEPSKSLSPVASLVSIIPNILFGLKK